MRDAEDYDEINQGKENFEYIYNSRDPRAYFKTLSSHDYVIPSGAKPIFSTLINELASRAPDTHVKVLDIGCSYGVNAALLKYDLDLDDLYRYFNHPPSAAPQADAVQDALFFESKSKHAAVNVVGLDAADRAIGYAVDVGLLDDGLAVNLEEETLDTIDAAKLDGTNLVISTGCIGYVGDATFEKLFKSFDTRALPWVASFVLRMFPYDPIQQKLEEFGMVTEKLTESLFNQRTFATGEEKESTVESLERRGLDPAPELARDGFLAEFFLTRPQRDVETMPLSKLVTRSAP